MSSHARTVVVAGDITLDWNLARDKPAGGAEIDAASRMYWQRGGVGMLADLVAAVADQPGEGEPWTVRQQANPGGADGTAPSPEDERFRHSFAAWKPFPYSAKETGKETAWRVSEFLGLRPSAQPAGDWARVVDDDAEARLVVLDDAGLEFRNRRDLWPASVSEPGRQPWVVVKSSSPVAQGELWAHLAAQHAGRLIVVMTVSDLRLTEVQISRELSWERTAQDLLWEAAFNAGFAGLTRAAEVVVSFHAAGAAHLFHDEKGKPACRLIFDPEVVEGMWEQGYPGRMVGYSSCLTAGIAREVMRTGGKPDVARGIHAGLRAMRRLHCEGYGQRGKPAAEAGLAFPLKKVVAALGESEQEFQEAMAPMRTGIRYWTILSERYKGGFDDVARQVVLKGPEKALSGVPFGRFGKLLTVDRQEIESLRSIRSLISEYLSQSQPKRPLSVAVFGPPGAGKSFGITQLALALRPGEIEPKEFNLSQLGSTEELLSAFHQVRDIALGGKVPLVFWDEFDSSMEGGLHYGWLRHFLAPMQDGKFQDGDLTHPIGKAIFVFAGGTSATLEEFGKDRDEKELRAAKAPDFISRLKGYINVLGPNPRGGDAFFILRRAILLRSMLMGAAGHLARKGELEIDSGVLRALLETRIYRHGARSMESLIAMSRLDGASRFERSCLPTRAQMNLHVDGQDFLVRVHQLELKGELLERMAEAAHEVYRGQQRAKLRAEGVGEAEETKVNPMLVDYQLLPEEIKEQNRDQVREIPAKLAHAGCYMVPAQESEPPFRFSPEMLEELASMEHTRWMRMKADQDWRWGDPRDNEKRLHPSMLPWKLDNLEPYAGFADRLGDQELSEKEKAKDREAIEKMVKILDVAGYTIVGPHKT